MLLAHDDAKIPMICLGFYNLRELAESRARAPAFASRKSEDDDNDDDEEEKEDDDGGQRLMLGQPRIYPESSRGFSTRKGNKSLK